MTYRIEVSKRDLSTHAEECLWKDEEGHNAEGTGEECDDQCKSLDGTTREIRDHGTETYEYDKDDAEEHGGAVDWGVALLTNRMPVAGTFPDLSVPQLTDGKAFEREWLSGSEDDPYRDQFTEYSIYLRGAWTDAERGAVFGRVG